MFLNNKQESGFAIEELATEELAEELETKYPNFINIDVYTEEGNVVVRAWHEMFRRRYGVEFVYDEIDDVSPGDLWGQRLFVVIGGFKRIEK